MTLWLCLLSIFTQLSTGSNTTAAIDELTDRARQSRQTCGPVAVYYCLNRLGYNVSLKSVLAHANVGDDGVSLSSILDSIHRLEPSLKPRAISVASSSFSSLPVPSILILEGHCMVYDGYDPSNNKVSIFEPTDRRSINVKPVELTHVWKGNVIVFEDLSIPRPLYYAAMAMSAILVVLIPWSGFLLFRRRVL